MNAASQKLKTAKTLETVGVKALQAKLHPKTVICNLLITIPWSHGYWAVYEEETRSSNATLFTRNHTCAGKTCLMSSCTCLFTLAGHAKLV